MSTQLAAYERQDLELEKISIGLENIISILAVIKQSPVIDKSMAKDLENEYPGIITTKASLESFSDTLSAKGHSIALESIKDRLRTMRDAIVKAFKNAVKKFKEWLDSIFRKSKDTSKEAKQKNDESSQAHATATALIEKHSDGIAVALNAKSNGAHLTAHDIADVINNAAAEILAKHTSKLILFMLKENTKIGQDEVKYLQHFDKDAQRLPALFTDIAHKIDTLVSDINSGKITNESDLSIYTVDIISFLELDDANASDKSEDVIKSAEQAATIIKQALNEMVAAPAFPEMTAEDLRGRNSELSLLWEKLSLINLQIDHYEHMSRVIQPIDKIENSLTHLEASVGKIQNAEGNSRGIATAIDNLRGCFKVAHLFLMSSKIAYDESIRFSKVLHKASFMQVKHLVEALATLPEGDKIISEMKKLAIVHSTGASLEDEDDSYDDLSHDVPDEDYDSVAAAFTEFDSEEDDEDHLTISNESIGDKIKEGAKAAYQKIKQLLQKLVDWIKKIFTGSSAASDSRENDAAASAHQETREEYAQETSKESVEETAEVMRQKEEELKAAAAAEEARKLAEARDKYEKVMEMLSPASTNNKNSILMQVAKAIADKGLLSLACSSFKNDIDFDKIITELVDTHSSVEAAVNLLFKLALSASKDKTPIDVFKEQFKYEKPSGKGVILGPKLESVLETISIDFTYTSKLYLGSVGLYANKKWGSKMDAIDILDIIRHNALGQNMVYLTRDGKINEGTVKNASDIDAIEKSISRGSEEFLRIPFERTEKFFTTINSALISALAKKRVYDLKAISMPIVNEESAGDYVSVVTPYILKLITFDISVIKTLGLLTRLPRRLVRAAKVMTSLEKQRLSFAKDLHEQIDALKRNKHVTAADIAVLNKKLADVEYKYTELYSKS